jgi:hypothetical protein
VRHTSHRPHSCTSVVMRAVQLCASTCWGCTPVWKVSSHPYSCTDQVIQFVRVYTPYTLKVTPLSHHERRRGHFHALHAHSIRRYPCKPTKPNQTKPIQGGMQMAFAARGYIVRKTPSWHRSGATSALCRCIPPGTRGLTCVLWADRTVRVQIYTAQDSTRKELTSVLGHKTSVLGHKTLVI